MDRIRAMFAGRPFEGRAFVAVLSLYGAKLTDCPVERYFNDPEAYASGQAAVRERFHPDILFAPFSFPLIGAAWGSKLHYMPRDGPVISHLAIGSAEEWDTIELPDVESQPNLLYLRESISRMASDDRERIPIGVVIPSPADLPELVMGLDAWLGAVLFDSERAHRIMGAMVPFFIQLSNVLLAEGADFLIMPCGLASPHIVTRGIAEDFTKPILIKALQGLRGPAVLHNVGAPILAHLDILKGLPSLAGFVLDEHDDIGKARRIVGPDPVLIGGFDCSSLPRMTAPEVEGKCQVILKDRERDRRFILGVSGPDVPWDTPPENIGAIRRLSESSGGPLDG